MGFLTFAYWRLGRRDGSRIKCGTIRQLADSRAHDADQRVWPQNFFDGGSTKCGREERAVFQGCQNG